jgi:biopolymer transport protein ExbD
MSKFKKKANVKQEIPTSSMPDVVFMLLFFFMVTTQLREKTIEVLQRIPEASQLRKLQRKSLVTNLFIGEPKKQAQYGKEPRIQAEDVFIEPKDFYFLSLGGDLPITIYLEAGQFAQ